VNDKFILSVKYKTKIITFNYHLTMNTDSIVANINSLVRLGNDEMEELKSALIQRPFKQGEIIVRGGDTARYLMFVTEGYVMTYYTDEGTDHVIRFAGEGWWVNDFYSIGPAANTLFTTKGLRDGELLVLPRSGLNELLEKYINIERYFRMLFHNSVIKQQMRFVKSNTDTAEERYLEFIAAYPNLEQYVAQKYIASYLGITPEFLSKVRKNLSRKIP